MGIIKYVPEGLTAAFSRILIVSHWTDATAKMSPRCIRNASQYLLVVDSSRARSEGGEREVAWRGDSTALCSP